MKHLQEFTRFAEYLTTLSGKVITSSFLSPDLIVEEKYDHTVVTKADRDAEAALRDEIRRRYPDHGILGEEWGTENGAAEFVWTLDPIDGTVSFVTGVPLFGTLIGLLHQGKPVLGVIHQPVLRQIMIGTDAGTTLNGRTVRVRQRTLKDATLLATDFTYIEQKRDAASLRALRERVAVTRTWGDCYGYLLLSSGLADIMLDPAMNPWDSVPLVPVVRGSGGVLTEWSGADAAIPASVIAASPGLHAEVLRILSGDTPHETGSGT